MKTLALIVLIPLVLYSCKKEVPEPNFPLEKLRDLNDHINPVRVDTIKY